MFMGLTKGFIMSRRYTNYSSEFKFKVVLEALKGTRTITELCQEFQLAASQIYDWKNKLKELGAQIFSTKAIPKENNVEIELLHATIGKLKVECDFLAKALGR
jgi:transposase-like protein